MITNVHTLKIICFKSTKGTLQLACCEPAQLKPSVLKMEIETDLREVDNFPGRACQVSLTHCQQTTNAMPIFNPVPDGKETCPRKFWNVPQLELKHKLAKNWFTFLLYFGNQCCLCFDYIKHAGRVFLFKFQDLGNDTSYLTHILHFFEWRLLFCFVFCQWYLALTPEVGLNHKNKDSWRAHLLILPGPDVHSLQLLPLLSPKTRT